MFYFHYRLCHFFSLFSLYFAMNFSNSKRFSFYLIFREKKVLNDKITIKTMLRLQLVRSETVKFSSLIHLTLIVLLGLQTHQISEWNVADYRLPPPPRNKGKCVYPIITVAIPSKNMEDCNLY